MQSEIDKLQEKMAYQEQIIDTLNEALSDQQKQLMKLEQDMRKVIQFLQHWRDQNDQADTSNPSGTTHELPPHY